jgi:hypothetical protein
MTDQRDAEERAESSENADPMENADMNEPTDPTDRAEPTDAMDSTDPLDPIDRIDPSDHRDHFDVCGSASLMPPILPSAHPLSRHSMTRPTHSTPTSTKGAGAGDPARKSNSGELWVGREGHVSSSHGDDDLRACVLHFEVPDGLGCFDERIGPVDDGRDLSGLGEFP